MLFHHKQAIATLVEPSRRRKSRKKGSGRCTPTVTDSARAFLEPVKWFQSALLLQIQEEFHEV